MNEMMNEQKRYILKSKPRIFFAAAILIFSALSVALLNAQSVGDSDIQEQLESEYINKVLVIRHFYSGDTLKYDSKGTLTSGGKPESWVTSAYFEPEEVKLSKSSITITGKRISMGCVEQGYAFPPYGRDVLPSYRCKNDTKIEISRSSKQKGQSETMASLGCVFLKGDESLEDSIPPYWKGIIEDGLNVEQTGQYLLVTAPDIRFSFKRHDLGHLTVGTQIPYPLPLPPYTEIARKKGVKGGVVRLLVIIGEDGSVEETAILKSLEKSLDESVMETVERTWKFYPTLLDGVPIPWFIYTEVSFNIYY